MQSIRKAPNVVKPGASSWGHGRSSGARLARRRQSRMAVLKRRSDDFWRGGVRAWRERDVAQSSGKQQQLSAMNEAMTKNVDAGPPLDGMLNGCGLHTELQTDEAPSARGGRESSRSEGIETEVWGSGEDLDPEPPEFEVVRGRLLLLIVAALWGTYAPALKYLYSLPGPPTPAVLTAVRASIGAAVLVIGTKVWRSNSDSGAKQQQQQVTTPELTGDRNSRGGSQGKGSRVGLSLKNLLTWSSGSLLLSGAELGLWNFLGSSTQAVGLEYTTATRSAFLIQSTALFTPVIATLAGDRLPPTGWIGCAIGLVGSIIVTLEAKAPSVAAMATNASGFAGDTLVLCAAVLYALNTVRIGTLARRFNPLDLATSKTLVLAASAILWAAWECAGVVMDGRPLVSLWAGFNDWHAWLALIWTALGPGALASFLQTTAQNAVRPAQAQVFLASTPFWSALLAGAFLAGEAMGSWGWLGGIIIICGGLLSTVEAGSKLAKAKKKAG